MDLLREVERLKLILDSISVPPELHDYHAWISSACDSLREQVLENIYRLDLNVDDITVEILSDTQRISRQFALYNKRLAGPVFRCQPSDRFCLKLFALAT
jgi:hypothetical protein